MLEQLRQQLRRYLLERLRPGRDVGELVRMLARAQALHSDEHRSMLEHLVAFSDVRVRELMVPRSDIQAAADDDDAAAVAQLMVQSGHSRLPVYAGDLDHIQGVVHAWDLFAAQVRGEAPALRALVRPCLKVPESQLVLGLFTRMKRSGCHIAIALDEYGGTAGLVTLTDLLGEIFGPMGEAGEEAEDEECVRQQDGSYIVSARMHIEDLAEVLGASLPDGDFDTVGGLITSQLGHIPATGESLEVGGLHVDVLEAEPRRVLKVRVRLRGD